MVLHREPFTNRCGQVCHDAGWCLIYPCYWLLNRLISCFISTTAETAARTEDPCYERYVILSFLIPLLIILTLLSMPVALIGFILWAPAQRFKYSYVYVENKHWNSETAEEFEGVSLTTATANVCLMPEFLARINNLADMPRRARVIAQRILESQMKAMLIREESILDEPVTPSDSGSVTPCEDTPLFNPKTTKSNSKSFSRLSQASHKDTTKEIINDVSIKFPPNLSFLCLQEVFDRQAGRILSESLLKQFPYILHDVGVFSWHSNCFMINSGLFFASRYPILEAEFCYYADSVKEDGLAAKGLLMVKVEIGPWREGQRLVGYIANTHLQAFQGESNVRTSQLDCIARWVAQFQQTTLATHDVIACDLLCGDFNFDNMSTGDEQDWNHNLWKCYKDPCRIAPGRDHPWTVGTELVQKKMHKKEVSSPQGLQSALRDDHRRSQYVHDLEVTSDVIDGIGQSELGLVGDNNGRRRIDFTFHSPKSVDSRLMLEVEEVSFVTQLATLTDHIPVAMKVSVTPKS